MNKVIIKTKNVVQIVGFSRHRLFNILLSSVGGALAVLAVVQTNKALPMSVGAALIIASLGASSVLLFAMPHALYSQPWPLIGGHTISAFIGVTCSIYVNELYVAAALAVGISIGVMQLLRCIHPPGGATALTAVIGGSVIHSMGYGFVVTPVLSSAVVIFFVAMIVHYPFPKRRYPMAFFHRNRHN